MKSIKYTIHKMNKRLLLSKVQLEQFLDKYKNSLRAGAWDKIFGEIVVDESINSYCVNLKEVKIDKNSTLDIDALKRNIWSSNPKVNIIEI